MIFVLGNITHCAKGYLCYWLELNHLNCNSGKIREIWNLVSDIKMNSLFVTNLLFYFEGIEKKREKDKIFKWLI